jgi:2-pyrone-4,6-dicarboxylate lactonase
MTEIAPVPTYHPAPSKPKLPLPPRACDTHCHVFGPRGAFPYSPNRTYTPADAPKESLFALHDLLGIERAVIVQPGIHGSDHRATADALASRPGRYRAVALLAPDVDDGEIANLDRAGFCAVRFNFMPHLGPGTPMEDVLRLAGRLAEFGWHLQIHTESSLIEALAPGLRQSPVPVVIDHMGRVDASEGLDQRPFRALMELLEDDRFWVKVSGCERASRQPPPHSDAIPFARRLVETYGDRVLWGTDWPHPNFRAEPPDDGALVDLLSEIAPTQAQRQALLVDNPQRLFRFTG